MVKQRVAIHALVAVTAGIVAYVLGGHDLVWLSVGVALVAGWHARAALDGFATLEEREEPPAPARRVWDALRQAGREYIGVHEDGSDSADEARASGHNPNQGPNLVSSYAHDGPANTQDPPADGFAAYGPAATTSMPGPAPTTNADANAPARRAPVRKAPVATAPVKKAPVKKAPVKKAPVKKAPVKKAAPRKAAPRS